MSTWGPATYGDPCSGCRFLWTMTQRSAQELVYRAPSRFRTLLWERDGGEHHPDLAWSAGAYLWHVADNLRIWAERLSAATQGGSLHVIPYDADELAAARGYERLPVEGGLWALERAAQDWLGAVDLAAEAGVVLIHPERGRITTLDIARTNAHDVDHHTWDVRRCLGHVAAT